MINIEHTNYFKLSISGTDMLSGNIEFAKVDFTYLGGMRLPASVVTLTGVKALELKAFYDYKMTLWKIEGTKEYSQTKDEILACIAQKFKKYFKPL